MGSELEQPEGKTWEFGFPEGERAVRQPDGRSAGWSC